MWKWIFFIFLGFFLHTSIASADIKVEGRIFTEKGPLKDAIVHAYKNYEDIGNNKPFLVSEPSNRQGAYKINLPPGEYWFTVTGEDKGKDFFAYHGNNPIRIKKENVWLSFMANEVKKPVYLKGETSLRGVVTYKGKPIKDAYISLYTPETRTFRGLGFRTDSIDSDGTFNISVPIGEYVVIAKKMENDKRIRPLKKGDLFCYYPLNPVEVRSDRITQIEIPCYPKNDRSAFVESPAIKANDYVTVDELSMRNEFGIKGRVVNIEGRPASGVYVLAYKGDPPSTAFMMFHIAHGTEYVARTDADGNYFIPLDSDGYYRIIARSVLGGSPHSGELYGLYGGNPWHVVSYKKGQVIDNINIVVGEAMVEKVRYKDNDAVKVKDVVYETDHIIDRDTVWEGNILINGTFWIKRGVTLYIEPGTVVKFKKLDRDNNGIGDGEIIVEGRIIARGTREKRILFSSDEKNPQPKDWSYILFLSTGSDSILEYCELQYAFTGIQIHYSNAKVTDCIFRNNHEALRYNRSNVIIEHNSFMNNDIGIRFVRLEGNAVIRNNLLTENNVGILFMQPHGKTVNFYMEPSPAEMKFPLIRDNNIFNNYDYNYKIGERKSVDLDVTNNWWGSLKEEEIDEFIFDKKDDDGLGMVVYTPMLNGPVKDAGVRDKKI